MLGTKSPLVSTIPRSPLNFAGADHKVSSRAAEKSKPATTQTIKTNDKREIRMLALNKDFIDVVASDGKSRESLSKRSQPNNSYSLEKSSFK